MSITPSKPKISVLMPVYNVEKYLRASIDSVLNQTLSDIELICVDDASTDGSADILREYAAKDPRVKLVFHKKNSGLVMARKSATVLAQGEYIMLLDSDDEYAPNACETVWNEEQANPVDILQFGTNIVFCNNPSEEERKNTIAYYKPYKSYFGDLVEASFQSRLWNHNIWNKAYNASAWKKGLSYACEDYINVSEDEYLYFLVAYHANSYRGIFENLYTYYIGRGLTGQVHLSYSQFAGHCDRKKAYTSIDVFLQRVQAPQSYFEICKQMYDRALSALVYEWFYQVSATDAKSAYDYLISVWGGVEVVSFLTDICWNDADQVILRLAPAHTHTQEKAGKPVKNIGIYYYRMSNGGVERVISYLIPLWIQMGYKIVLITEYPPTSNEYPLPEEIVRVQIPSVQESIRINYAKRAQAWADAINQYEIDTIVYAAHVCDLLMWDVCLIKAIGCNFIIHSHNSHSLLFLEKVPFRYLLTHSYRLADRVITLSRIFSEYWGNFCPAYYIPNPVGELCPREETAQLNGKNILWVGRISAEKQPYDAVRIFEKVKECVPDAVLTMVGEGETPDSLRDLQTYASQRGLTEAVHFEGFHRDVSPYYQNADIFMMTSQYEGFPMVLVESKSYGLPIVMYDLPYLEMVRDNRGVITAPQGDIYAMANTIIRLLNNPVERKEIGRLSRVSAESFAAVNQIEKWKEVFESFSNPCGKAYITSEQESMMLSLLLDSDQQGESRRGGVAHSSMEPLENRLICSKFMKIATWYWKATDPLKHRLKRLKRILINVFGTR